MRFLHKGEKVLTIDKLFLNRMFDMLTVDLFFKFNLMGLNLITIICNYCLIISYSILIFFLW